MGGRIIGGLKVNEVTATTLVSDQPATVTVHWTATPATPAPVSADGRTKIKETGLFSRRHPASVYGAIGSLLYYGCYDIVR